MDIANSWRPLKVIGSWVSEGRVKTLNEEDVIVVFKSSAYGGSLTMTFEETGRLDVMPLSISGNCSLIDAKRSVATDCITEDTAWVIVDKI